EEVSEILYPYEPEESSENAVGEEVTEILCKYEPEENSGEKENAVSESDSEEETYIPAHAADVSAYVPKLVKVVRKQPEKPPEPYVPPVYDVDTLLRQSKERGRKYDTSDINMPTLEEILAEHRRKKGGRK
ncbi:MAG: hypothetical protein NC078_04010, partial [Ruminococcus sp.]|nr:hypothetical protein [Ruminococcus sp.]